MIATPDNWIWSSFRPPELACQHTGEHGMTAAFMHWLQALRDDFGHPMVITSGYRHPSHPIEARKSSPGTHSSAALWTWLLRAAGDAADRKGAGP